MKYSLLLVNYHTEIYIVKLLDDLCAQKDTEFEVIIANNSQDDKLYDVIVEYRFFDRLKIKLVQSSTNIGFGSAMNLASQQAIGEYLLIINPDIRIYDNQLLGAFASFLDAHTRFGVATCRLLDDGGIDRSEFTTFEFRYKLEMVHSPRWFSGAFLIVPRQVYLDVDGFDEDFFMYCEDEDLCLRIQRMGLPLLKNNVLSVYHKGGVSEPIKGYDFFYRWFCSQLLFCHKHLPDEEFTNLLDRFHKSARTKIHHYRWLSKLPIPRYTQKYHEWQAKKSVLDKISLSGIDWLYDRTIK